MTSPKRLLLEHLYPGDLPYDVARWVESGQSWRVIAKTVAARTGQDVSYESLRVWYGATDRAAS